MGIFFFNTKMMLAFLLPVALFVVSCASPLRGNFGQPIDEKIQPKEREMYYSYPTSAPADTCYHFSCSSCIANSACQWCSYSHNDDSAGLCQNLYSYCQYTEYTTTCPGPYTLSTGVLFAVIFFPICIFLIIVATSPFWLPILGFAACWSYSRRTNNHGS